MNSSKIKFLNYQLALFGKLNTKIIIEFASLDFYELLNWGK
jgi:hypothetical protein